MNGRNISLNMNVRGLKPSATLPGADYERPVQELSARLAYVNFDGAQALSAGKEVPLDRDLPADFLDKHCANTLEAMRRIAGWVSETPR